MNIKRDTTGSMLYSIRLFQKKANKLELDANTEVKVKVKRVLSPTSSSSTKMSSVLTMCR